MTELKEKAMKIIEQIPEENMKYVLKKLGDMQEEFKPVAKEEKKKQARAAWEEIHRIMAPHLEKFPADFDYKKELQEYRDERYGFKNIG